MKRRHGAPIVLALLGLAGAAIVLLGGCDGDARSSPRRAAGAQPSAGAGDDRGATPGETANGGASPESSTGLVVVELYFPSSEEAGLVGEVREIFLTAAPGDRAKQIVTDLISGPTNDLALRALPEGTRLRQIYVVGDGTAYIDFSEDLREGMGGGSTEELLTVYAIVDSIVVNVVEIERVGILIDGKPIDTLNGHMDLRRPLAADLSFIVGRVAWRGLAPTLRAILALA